MNVSLWVLQIVLAGMFAMSGITKSTQPRRKLLGKLRWVEDYSAGTVRFIGIVELLGAIGLVVPAATGIVPVLTPLAATGLAVVMALATNTHRRRREPSAIAFTAVLFAVAVVIAWGRFGPYSL
ncbi:DoxX-like protein [Kribbella sp. VKM Ac-2527]|uniref:DoxX-like protein n=1 Tax=Kribbella caucasensis TaxID=2512215 RepID=A0A4R6IYD4_9ACTN|nr:DoxX family protein [Kribbella sp. VKM Ac-2527]TDO27793.1 DoxX-like protein [Kribbella sp. VKM Ac-2527]